MSVQSEDEIWGVTPYKTKLLDEKNALIKHLMGKNSRLRDCLEKCEQDYHGVINVAKQFSLHETKKDAVETREYIRKILAENQ